MQISLSLKYSDRVCYVKVIKCAQNLLVDQQLKLKHQYLPAMDYNAIIPG